MRVGISTNMDFSFSSITIAISIVILMFVLKKRIQSTFDDDKNLYLFGGILFFLLNLILIQVSKITSLEHTYWSDILFGISLGTLYMGAYLLKSWLMERNKKN